MHTAWYEPSAPDTVYQMCGMTAVLFEITHVCMLHLQERVAASSSLASCSKRWQTAAQAAHAAAAAQAATALPSHLCSHHPQQQTTAAAAHSCGAVRAQSAAAEMLCSSAAAGLLQAEMQHQACYS
jgi:hypothetical protein